MKSLRAASLLLLMAATQTSLPDHAMAGGWTGNGGDFISDQDNTWFLGDAPVPYCVHVSPTFSIAPAEVNAMVTQALTDWIGFFRKYGIDRNRLGSNQTLTGKFPDGITRGMSLDFRRIDDCKSIREPHVEFWFGQSNATIQKYLRVRSNQVGAAIRGPYDSKTFRNGGDVWIDNTAFGREWKAYPALLKHLLLHEIGHVFGMQHDSVYVMHKDTGELLLQQIKDTEEHRWGAQIRAFGVIESPTWPFHLKPGTVLNFSYADGGFFSVPTGYSYNAYLPEEIRQLFGIPKDGGHTLKLSLEPNKAMFLEIGLADGRTFRIPAEGYDLSRVTASPASKGPGIYTLWASGRPEGYYTRLSYDDCFMKPEEGYFTLNGTKLPSVIKYEHGIRLNIFLPHSGKWWRINPKKELTD